MDDPNTWPPAGMLSAFLALVLILATVWIFGDNKKIP